MPKPRIENGVRQQADYDAKVESTSVVNGVRFTILKPGNAEGAQTAEYPDRKDHFNIRQWPN